MSEANCNHGTITNREGIMQCVFCNHPMARVNGEWLPVAAAPNETPQPTAPCEDESGNALDGDRTEAYKRGWSEGRQWTLDNYTSTAQPVADVGGAMPDPQPKRSDLLTAIYRSQLTNRDDTSCVTVRLSHEIWKRIRDHLYNYKNSVPEPVADVGGALPEHKCKYCGEGADHKCGQFHACGDCCGNHGELTRLDKRLYQWVRDTSNAHGRTLAENAELRRKLATPGETAWIDCKQELPPDDRLVLVWQNFFSPKTALGRYWPHILSWSMVQVTGDVSKYITHWATLTHPTGGHTMTDMEAVKARCPDWHQGESGRVYMPIHNNRHVRVAWAPMADSWAEARALIEGKLEPNPVEAEER